MSEDLTPEEVRNTIDRLVRDLLDSGGIVEPPVDVIDLARRDPGLSICLDRLSQEAGRGRPRPRLPRPDPTEEGRQWRIAQAIGDHVKDDLLKSLGFDPRGPRPLLGESLTNLFAARLLLPTSWFAGVGRSVGWDLLELKEKFRTASHEVIAWRMLDVEEPCVITILDNDAIHKRKSNRWAVKKDLSPAERECQGYLARYSRPHTVRGEGWRVQGWPIHQSDWRREVLRSVIEED